MANTVSILHQKSLMVIIAYAPTGLGHLRVTDALYHGLPKEVTPIILESQDHYINFMHRFTSINPYARTVFEWTQKGLAEDVFSRLFRMILKSNTQNIYRQITTLIDQRLERPSTVLMIATHFGQAHQLAAVKQRISDQKGVRIILVVQVTDDTPQHMWYVPGADLILVPSEQTKNKLMKYGKDEHLPEVKFAVSPYPVSPAFCEWITPQLLLERKTQTIPDGTARIHISIPVSGAAVGTSFFIKLMENLHTKSSRFSFHVVSKNVPYTKTFIETIQNLPYINLYTSSNDRMVIDKYDLMYKTEVVSMEITKPSEQAFKALLRPNQRGGAIMLFSDPIGKQEYDNLDFLRRYGLIPKVSEQTYLWEKAKTKCEISHKKMLLRKVRSWRGLVLPKNPFEAANFIFWCLNGKIFENMMRYKPGMLTNMSSVCKSESQSRGTHEFWKKVTEVVVGK